MEQEHPGFHGDGERQAGPEEVPCHCCLHCCHACMQLMLASLCLLFVCDRDWTTQLVVLPEGIGDECIVMGCIRTLQINYKSAIDMQLNSVKGLGGRPLQALCLQSDGKRKILLNRWCLYTLGTHTHRYVKEKKLLVHSFRPFCYVLMRNETALNITIALTSLKATARLMWGEQYVVDFWAGGGDKAGVRAYVICHCRKKAPFMSSALA